MTPSDFIAWMREQNLTTLTAAGVLGTTRRTIERRLAGSVPITLETALACAAVSAGLGAWKRKKKEKAIEAEIAQVVSRGAMMRRER